MSRTSDLTKTGRVKVKRVNLRNKSSRLIARCKVTRGTYNRTKHKNCGGKHYREEKVFFTGSKRSVIRKDGRSKSNINPLRFQRKIKNSNIVFETPKRYLK